MNALLRDPQLQSHLDEKGWVTLPLLDDRQVAELRRFYDAHPPQELPEYGFHVSLDQKGDDYVSKVRDQLHAVAVPELDRFFQNFKVFTAAFVVKEPQPKGVVPPHQDWTFTDETKYRSLTVWIALVDTHMDNGCMGVINGSHKFWEYIRCSPSPQAPTPISPHMFTIFPYLQLKPMKAGEALVFDNRTIHASPPNTTENPRIAAGIGVTHQEAPLVHHYLVPESDPPVLERYAIDSDWFLRYNNGRLSDMYNQGQKPGDCQVLATVPRELPELDHTALLEMIKSDPENTMNVPLVEKMAALFNYNPDGSKKDETPPPAAPVAELPASSGIKGWLKRIFTR